MPETKRRPLPGEKYIYVFGDGVLDFIGEFTFALCDQPGHKFGIAVKVVLDCALRAARDKNKICAAGLYCLLHCKLNERLVDDREQFLGHCLGCGQEPSAKPRHREYRLAHAPRHPWLSPIILEIFATQSPTETAAPRASTLRRMRFSVLEARRLKRQAPMSQLRPSVSSTSAAWLA